MIVTKTDIQIRFADVDSLGHVNNVNLQHYFDLGKNDFFTTVLGVDHVDGAQGIITAATNTSYIGQVRLRDTVYVETSLQEIGNKSLMVYQRLMNQTSGEVCSESTSVMVAFNFELQESITIPERLRQAAEAAM